MNLFLSKVYAQVDGVASPTIPFTPPGSITPTTAGPTTAVLGPSISLTSEETTLEVDTISKIQIVIDTKLQPISQYSIQLLFSPEYLRVVDFDDSTDSIEIDFRDTFFDSTINEVSQQQGIISISAENPAGVSSITNRVIAEVQVEALKAGFAEVTIGRENTNLLTSGSVDILQNTTKVEFVIGGGGTGPTSTFPSPTINPNATILPTSEVVLPSRTPDTAITDNLRAPAALILGVMLISLGSYFIKLRNTDESKKS